MRALKIGIIMLLVLLLLICCGISFLHHYTDNFNSMLEEAQNYYNSGDHEGAAGKINELKNILDESRDILCILLDHVEVNEAEVSLLKLAIFAESDEDEYFNAECDALISRIKNMYSSEKLTLANVF